MLELNHKEPWTLKNWCFWTVVLEKTLESPLDCEEIQPVLNALQADFLPSELPGKPPKPVHVKGDKSWVFIGRTDAEAETPYFGHLMRKADSFEKTLMLGKIEDRRTGWQRTRLLDGLTDFMEFKI